MTKQGIKKLATMHKLAQGGFWGTAQKLGGLTLAVLALAVVSTGFAGGMLYSKFTAPRKTDMDNVTKQYQVARLKSDIQKQKALLSRQQNIYDDKEQPKKSVYGLV